MSHLPNMPILDLPFTPPIAYISTPHINIVIINIIYFYEYIISSIGQLLKVFSYLER